MSEKEILLQAIASLQKLVDEGAILERTIITNIEEAFESRIVIEIECSI